MPDQANLAHFCELGWIREARQAWVHDPRLAPVRQDMSLATLPIGPLLQTPWPGHQRQISVILHRDRLHQLKTNLAPREQVRLHSLAGDAAGAWLSAFPSEWGCRFRPEQFQIACRLRLGAEIPGLRQHAPLTCVCGTQVDDLADHLLLCRRGSQRFRHLGLTVGTLRHTVVGSSTTVHVEHETHIISDNPCAAGHIGSEARMDLVAHQIDGAPPVWIDVTVVCPISASPTVMANRAAGTACALRDAEATKRRKYGAAAQGAGATFAPFALDTFGRRGKDARKFLAGLAKKIVARQTGHPPGLLTGPTPRDLCVSHGF